MTSYEQTLLQEIAILPESRRADVLAFVRYLRLSLMDDRELERRYDAAITTIRETAERYTITEIDIEEEIRAVREERRAVIPSCAMVLAASWAKSTTPESRQVHVGRHATRSLLSTWMYCRQSCT